MPVYQKAGIQLAAIPQMTTVGIQESARTAQTLSSALDRLSSFAFKQAEIGAQIEGREYGALNAPTAQQLQDAVSAGKDVSQIVPGDKTTVFGRAASEAALSSLTSAMELEARKSIVDIQAKFEAGEIDLPEMQTRLENLSLAQTEVLRQVSPMAAQKFSASIGVTANSAYLSAAKTEASNNRKDLEITYRAGVDTYIRNAETIVRAGDTIDDSGQVVTVDQKIQSIRESILVAAQQINDPTFYQTKLNELDAAVTEAKIGVVMDEAMLQPAAALGVIRGEGKFQDPEVQATFASLKNEERRELFTQIQSALSTQYGLDSAAEAANERKRTKRSEELQAQFTGHMLNGNNVAAESILRQLRDVDAKAWEAKKEVLATTPGIDDKQTIANLRVLSLRNQLTYTDIDTAFRRGKMSMTSYKEFMGDLEQQRNQAYNRAITFLKESRGLPDVPLFNAKGIDRKAQQEVAGVKTALIEALAEDPSINPLQFVKERIAEIEAAGAGAANVALRQEADRVADELRISLNLPNASAQELLNALQANPGAYPNQQRRTNALENLLPLLIQIESEQR